jgi:hypothetical protein
MADLAKQHTFNIGSTTSPLTPSADTTGDTWMVVSIAVWTGVIANLTTATYNGVSFLGTGHSNGTTTHFAAAQIATYYMALGANAGNNAFNIAWTGGGELSVVAVSGNGDIDAAVIDATGFVDVEVVSGAGLVTPTPYTPTANKALPIFNAASQSQTTFTANANCTFDIKNTRVTSQLFHGPLSTPAGTPTSAVMNDAATEFVLFTSLALKPQAAAGGGNWGPMLGQQLNRIVQG